MSALLVTVNIRKRLSAFVRQAMKSRVLVAVLGVLPATALGVVAVLGVIYGGRMIVRVDLTGALLVVWGSLGVAGVAGLWLAALGRDARPAIVFVVCGLIADGPLAVVAAVALAAGELSWLPVLIFPPFIVGVVYVVACLRGRLAQGAVVR
jgi:hypothetical protein